jgi:hypothetical protein
MGYITRDERHRRKFQYITDIILGGHKNTEVYEETMTLKMAQDSGYTGTNDGGSKVGWKPGINRKLKLRYGALSIIIKSYIPEILGPASDIAEVAEDYPAIEAPKTVALPAESANNKPDQSDTIKPMETANLAERLQASKTQVNDQPVVDGVKGGN